MLINKMANEAPVHDQNQQNSSNKRINVLKPPTLSQVGGNAEVSRKFKSLPEEDRNDGIYWLKVELDTWTE